MLREIVQTGPELAPLFLRLALAVVIFPHGAQKLLGWFGGYGFQGTMGYFAGLGFPAILGLAAILAESVGALGLLLGFLTRPAAAAIAVVMAVAAWTVHRPNGFFMNWFGQQKGEGYEFHILAAGLALALVVTGGGLFSIDRALSR